MFSVATFLTTLNLSEILVVALDRVDVDDVTCGLGFTRLTTLSDKEDVDEVRLNLLDDLGIVVAIDT